MHVIAARPNSRIEDEHEEHRRVWIEPQDGSIVRGVITILSIEGAIVRLTGSTSMAPGDEVAVRIALPRTARTLGAKARVLSVQAADEGTDCELAWTHSGPERDQLAVLVTALG
jgi:hypothetical protein